MSASAIQVVVRLRPMNEKEKNHGTLPVVTASTNTNSVTVIKGQGNRQAKTSYTFDNVFTAFSTQDEVFEQTLKPVIGDVLKGFESTIFAYGQTGTGKTHTMEGDIKSEVSRGIIPRAAQSIFEKIKQPTYSDHTITCSYLEIYNEELCDLLADDNKTGGKRTHQGNTKLEIMGGKDGPFCRGLTEREVYSAADVLKLMQKAQQNRKVGETKMNKQSSRSHCIFTMRVNAKATVMENGTAGQIDFTGKLHMVDLAGSECAKTATMDKASGDDVARERERMNINRSLLTLGRVIQMLKESSEQKSNRHVRIPYRDSKLTRILQESLGGRCKTVIIATLSPSATAIEESISTLNYAQSANGIVNKPVSSSFMAIGSGSVMSSNSLSNESSEGLSVEHWHKMECRLEYMKAQVEEAQGALARKHLQQQELVDRVDKIEAEKLETEKNLLASQMQVNLLKERLEKEKRQRRQISSKLNETQYLLQRTSALLNATEGTEMSLTVEANGLIETLKSSISDGDALHSALNDHYENDVLKKKATVDFNNASIAMLEKLLSNLRSLSNEVEYQRSSSLSIADKVKSNQKQATDNIRVLLDDTTENILALVSSLKSIASDDGGLVHSMDDVSMHITDSVQSMIAQAKLRDEHFESCSNSIRSMLNSRGEKLVSMSSAYDESSSYMKENLAANISQSNGKLFELMRSTHLAVATIHSERSKARKVHSQILSKWEKLCEETTSSVSSQTESSKAALDESLRDFLNGRAHHDNISELLTKQKSFLEINGQNCRSEIESQFHGIRACQDLLTTTKTNQQKARDSLLKNVMNGIQELLSNQLQSLGVGVNEFFTDGLTLADGLLEKNSSINTSTTHLIDSIGSTSAAVADNLLNAKKSSNEVATRMESTSKSLSSINQIHQEFKPNFEDLAKRSDENFTIESGFDSDIGGAMEKMSGGCSEVSKYLTESVLTEAAREVEKHACIVRDMQNLSSSSYSYVHESIDTMENENREALKRVKSGGAEVDSALVKSKVSLKKFVNEQADVSCKLSTVLEGAKESFTNVIAPASLKGVEYLAKSIEIDTDKFRDVSANHISKGSVLANDVQNGIQRYSNEVIQFEEDIPPVARRLEHQFCVDLPATAAIEEVLTKADIPTVYEAGNYEDISLSDDESLLNEKENEPASEDRRLSLESAESLSAITITSTEDSASFNGRTSKHVNGRASSSSTTPTKSAPHKPRHTSAAKKFKYRAGAGTPSKAKKSFAKRNRAYPSPNTCKSRSGVLRKSGPSRK